MPHNPCNIILEACEDAKAGLIHSFKQLADVNGTYPDGYVHGFTIGLSHLAEVEAAVLVQSMVCEAKGESDA
jgi:hypothetical protein